MNVIATPFDEHYQIPQMGIDSAIEILAWVGQSSSMFNDKSKSPWFILICIINVILLPRMVSLAS